MSGAGTPLRPPRSRRTVEEQHADRRERLAALHEEGKRRAMSFVDGIFSGIAGAVRGVLGMDPGASARSEDHASAAPVARDTSTGFDRPAEVASDAVEVAPGAFRGFSLAGLIDSSPRATDPTARTTSAPTPRASTAQHPTATSSVPAPSDPTSMATPPTPRARVLDAATRAEHGTVDTLVGQGDAAVAARNVQHGLDYFASTFGRNGVDGAGAGVDVIIDDRSLTDEGTERFRGNGGYYATRDSAGAVHEAIHFGTGTSYQAANGQVDQHSMLHADDLAIHELVHGVIRKETGHLGGEADEAGATNEALADVIAASATRDWRIGEDMYTERSDYRTLRDIANPEDPTAIHGLWTSMADVDAAHARGEEVEEHWASGVLSTAAYRVQQRLGGERGWQAVEQVFYGAITGGQLGDMGFDAVASALRSAAASRYGTESTEHQVLDEELRRAGL
jgi:hypothetical protein